MSIVIRNPRLDTRLRTLSLAGLFAVVALLGACGQETRTTTEQTTTRQIVPATAPTVFTTTTKTQQTTP